MVANPACWRLTVLAAAAAACVTACAGAETAAPPPSPPRVELTVIDETGSPWSPPPEGDGRGAVVVEVELRAATSAEGTASLPPAVDGARLVMSSASPDGTLPTPRLLRGARVGSLDPAAPGAGEPHDLPDDVELGRLRHALLPGSLVSFVLVDLDAGARGEGPLRRRAMLSMRRHAPIPLADTATDDTATDGTPIDDAPIDEVPEELIELALTVEGRDRPLVEVSSGDSESAEVSRLLPEPDAPVAQETVLLSEGIEVDGAPVLAVLPFPFGSGSYGVLVARMTARTATADDAALLEEARVARGATVPGPLRRTWGGPDDGVAALDRPSVTAAWEGLSRWSARRGALLYLAAGGGADLAEDVALVGSDALLAKLAAAVLDAREDAERDVAPANVGWLLERAAFDLLTGLVADDEHAEVDALLARHAGEAGRDPTALAELAQAASDVTGFRRSVVLENVLALEDSSPAARLRAYDWLRVRDHAPDGFDPLASPEERRAALRRWAEGEEP